MCSVIIVEGLTKEIILLYTHANRESGAPGVHASVGHPDRGRGNLGAGGNCDLPRAQVQVLQGKAPVQQGDQEQQTESTQGHAANASGRG